MIKKTRKYSTSFILSIYYGPFDHMTFEHKQLTSSFSKFLKMMLVLHHTNSSIYLGDRNMYAFSAFQFTSLYRNELNTKIIDSSFRVNKDWVYRFFDWLTKQ